MREYLLAMFSFAVYSWPREAGTIPPLAMQWADNSVVQWADGSIVEWSS